MSEFPTGYYQIHPVDAPQGDYLSTGPYNAPPVDLKPVVVDDNYTVWQVINSVPGNVFNLIAGLGKPGPTQFKGFNKDNALYVTSPGPADNFRIESAGSGFWTIGIPDEDLLLTYHPYAYPPLTFEPANGSSAQKFQFLHPQAQPPQ